MSDLGAPITLGGERFQGVQGAFTLDLSPADGEFAKAVGLQDEETSRFDSFVQGFKLSNALVQGYKALTTTKPEFTPDPTFNPINKLKQEPTLKPLMQIMEADTNARDTMLMARSEEEFAFLSQVIQEKYQNIREMAENQISGILGVLAGSVLDVSMFLPAANQIKALRATVKTAQQARNLGMLRVGGLAGVDAVAFSVAEQVNDPTADETDFLLNVGLGVGAGATLGGVIGRYKPQWLGMSVSDNGIINLSPNVDEFSDIVSSLSKSPHKPASVGAAATPADEGAALARDVIDKTSAPTINDKLSPIGRAQTMSKVANKELGPKGYSAPEEGFTLYNRLVTNRALLENQVAGGTRRADVISLQDELIGKWRTADIPVEDQRLDAMAALGENMWLPMAQSRKVLGLDVPVPGHRVGQREWLHIVDNYRHAMHNGDDLSLIWPEHVNLTKAEQDKLLPFVRKSAQMVQQRNDEFLKELKAHGLIDDNDLIENAAGTIPYSVQLMDIEEILTDQLGFRNMLRKLFRKEPMDEFLIERGFVEAEEITYTDGTKVQRASKRFRDLDPEVREEAIADWNAEMVRLGEISADEALADIRKVAKAKKNEAVLLITQRQIAKVRKLRELRDKWNTRANKLEEEITTAEASPTFKNSKTHDKRYKNKDRALRLRRETEEALATAEDELRYIIDRRRSVQDMREWINLHANRIPKVKKLIAEAAKKEAGASVKQAKLEAGITGKKFDFERYLDNMIDEIINPAEGRPPGWVPEGSVGRFMPKQFDLSSAEFRYDPAVQRFYKWDMSEADSIYERQVMPRLAIRKVFGNRTIEDEVKRVTRRFNEDIDEALAAGDKKSAALLTNFRDQTVKDVQEINDRLLGISRHSNAARWASKQIKRLNSSTMLGSVILALPGDIGFADIAAGKVGRGMQIIWTAPAMRKSLRELSEIGEHRLHAILTMAEDVRNLDIRTRTLFDMDTYQDVRAIGGAHTYRRHLSRVVDNTTETMLQTMMTINLMKMWNKYGRAGAGALIAQDALNQLPKWDNLDEAVKLAWRRRGIGPDDAAKIAKLIEKHGTISIDKMVFPAWSKMEADDPFIMSKFHRAIRAVIRDSIPEGEIGQTPLFSSTPMGSVLLQFMTFPMMAKQLWRAPDPGSGLFVGSVTQALLWSALGEWARHTLRGEGEEWLERWNSTEGITQNLYGTFVRSALAVGFTSPGLEIATKTLSEPGNRILQEAGLPEVFPSAGKFRDDNILSIFAGPTGTQVKRVFGLTNLAAGSVTDPDEREKLADQALHAAPFSSHFALRALETYLED